MDYRVGAFGWKFAARRGAKLMARIKVRKDAEAGMYVATSDDLRGLVVEAETLDALLEEVRAAADGLMEEHWKLDSKPRVTPEFRVYDPMPCPA